MLHASLCAKIMVFRRITRIIGIVLNERTVEFKEQDERMMKIQKVLDGMTPHTRHILEECYLHEKKYKEVAAELNISISAVRKHIVKALKAIREEFAK